MSNMLTTLLQSYNNRHYWEYMGFVKVEFGDGCSGYLKYGEKVIPGSEFNCYEQLEELLMNG